MLKFWRRTGNKEHENCVASKNSNPKHTDALYLQKECTPALEPSAALTVLDEGENFPQNEVIGADERSKLCKTLSDVLADKGAISYFIQYMEVRNASALILCYLDIETFKHESIQEKDITIKSFCHESPVANRSDHDSLSVSTDDSLTGDSSSLVDYVTDPKVLDNNILGDLSESNLIKQKLSFTSDKSVETALVIFKKYIALEAKLKVPCSEEMRRDLVENICDFEQIKAKTCFDCLQNHLFEAMKNEHFTAFLETDFYSKHQIDVLTSGNVVLEDILHNETALFYFMEFLEQENKRSLLEFWIAATNLHQQLSTQREFFDPIEAQSDGIILYDKYFSLQAHTPLGFSDKVRFCIEQNICGENGLIIDCFKVPLEIVERYLKANYLKSFLASQLFYKYLSELINTVQASGYSTSVDHKQYSPSDCSSEKSFSTSTFLAMELPCERKKEVKANMSIDTRELCDPDTLWKRKKIQRLSMGRVTELGKYVADIEPEPDRKGFKLRDVVKRIVSLDEEEKRKEEMAWQVAEMIVKDITSVTLNSDGHL
ncbi:A-kinase anchor protein 10, mitochondrial [Euwallacea similis]|uniref:A-kinase anchor protein 10, mitochondrial n=1 Tax=Euwallacea similis TaxID=1736056 RepID=UPI00344CA4E1